MLLRIAVAFAVVATVASAASAPGAARFDHYQVFRVHPHSAEHVAALEQLESADVMLWNGARVGAASDIMVAPHRIAQLEALVQRMGMPSALLVENVQE